MKDSKWRCLFCFMQTKIRFVGLPLCPICRDQLYDFFWVTLVQIGMLSFGVISGLMFVVEEVLLFVVLVIVKHRLPAPWEKK